jgi:7-keto-8-aminopelargonate synthetase-like enzyme
VKIVLRPTTEKELSEARQLASLIHNHFLQLDRHPLVIEAANDKPPTLPIEYSPHIIIFKP